MGLIAAATNHAARVPAQVAGAILIGVDLGPNLSATGSLATILWLIVLRRESENVALLRFLRLGLIVMPPALLLCYLPCSRYPPETDNHSWPRKSWSSDGVNPDSW